VKETCTLDNFRHKAGVALLHGDYSAKVLSPGLYSVSYNKGLECAGSMTKIRRLRNELSKPGYYQKNLAGRRKAEYDATAAIHERLITTAVKFLNHQDLTPATKVNQET